jgi:hypothetical protein
VLRKIFQSKVLLVLLPLAAVWGYFFHAFYVHNHLILGPDAQTACSSANYFLHQISRGIFQTWKPYTEWGRPDDFIIQVYGELNPFLLTVAFLERLGFPFFISYFIYSVGYYSLGLAGFYLLARRITGHGLASYVAVVLLMFSGMGTNLFNDILVILLFVPMIWFFYFAVRFFTEFDRLAWVGMTFTLMILVSTYIPAMFLALILAVLVIFILIFPDRYLPMARGLWTFSRREPWMVIGLVVCVGLCALPGLLWMISNLSGDYVAAWRGDVNAVSLTMEKINQGGLVARRGLADLFSNLDVMDWGEFYVPIFAFVVILLGMIVRINRKLIFLLILGFLLLAISAGDVSAVYVFLFHHLFFIKMFRNLHFILWFAVPVLMIFLAQLLSELLNYDPKTPIRRGGMIVFVLLVHAGFAYFLSQQTRVLDTSFWVVGLSALFFILYYAGILKQKSAIVPFLFLALVVIQPVQVAAYMRSFALKNDSLDYVRAIHSRQESLPVFSFIRPPKSQDDPYEQAMSFSDVRDASGFMDANFLGLRWSFLLHEKMDRTILSGYVRHKFIVYDAVKTLDHEEENLPLVAAAFAQLSNAAFVAPPGKDSPAVGGRAQVIEGNSSQFTVEKFDLNHIRFKTNFPSRKFLVYNDCFHKDEVFRANVAFKGLWLEAGQNTVEMVYRPWRTVFGFFLIFLFQAVLVYLIILAVKRRKRVPS